MASSQDPGDLDVTFDGDGVVITPLSIWNDKAHAMVIQPDDKIVLAGYVDDGGGQNDFALVRYTPDGDLDESFGEEGIVIHNLGNSDIAYALARDNNGNLVAAGRSGNLIAVARYKPDGEPDDTFSEDGFTTIPVGNDIDNAYAVAIQPDGKIIAAGYSSVELFVTEFTIVRLTSEGEPDPLFGEDGIVTTSFGTQNAQIRAIAVTEDLKIIAGGWSFNNLDTDFAVTRYLPDGALDEDFGENGILINDFGGSFDEIKSLLIQPDGKIVVAGDTWLGMNWDFAVARYLENGSPDGEFGLGGVVMTGFYPTTDVAYGLTLQPDGKIVAVGYTTTKADYDVAVVRYMPDGTPDDSFGYEGEVTVTLGDSYDQVFAAGMQSNGKILVAGYAYNKKDSYNFAVARFISGIAVGIPEIISGQADILIYPNPVKDDATINFESLDAGKLQIEIIDHLGRKVFEVSGMNCVPGRNEFALSLPATILPGEYTIVITTESEVRIARITKSK